MFCDILATLERRGIRYFITGSEAMARYAAPRTTLDIDVVVDVTEGGFASLADEVSATHVAAEPIRYANRALASLIDRRDGDKVDVIIRESDPWAGSALDRRAPWQHPSCGRVWVSSLEDLILAKLEWSAGTSELQLRDCSLLVRMNRDSIDWAYLGLWAGELGLTALLWSLHGSP